MTDPIEAATEAAAKAIARRVGINEFRGLYEFHKEMYRASARDAIAAYEQAKWRPIEEAPKDGTSVLISSENWRTVWRGHYRAIGTSMDAEIDQFGEGWTRENYSDINLQPTRFQPLPEPPKEAKP